MPSEHTSDQRPSLPSVFTLIEKAQEVRWTLQIAAVVLFSDLMLVWQTGSGITHWSMRTDQLLANSGFLITAVLSFCVLMSIVFPLTVYVCHQLLINMAYGLPWPRWMYREQDCSRPRDMVTANELRDHAVETGNDAFLERCDAHWQKWFADRSERWAMGRIVFSALVLALINYCARVCGIEGVTVLQQFVLTFGPRGEVGLAVGGILGCFWLKMLWFPVLNDQWINYPPLYEKIVQEQIRGRIMARPHFAQPIHGQSELND